MMYLPCLTNEAFSESNLDELVVFCQNRLKPPLMRIGRNEGRVRGELLAFTRERFGDAVPEGS